MIKLIATDLDATFLRRDKTFDHALFEQVLARVDALGMRFVIATGNHIARVREYFTGFEGRYDLIANNGAEVLLDGDYHQVGGIAPAAFPILQTLVDQLQQLPQFGLVFTASDRAYILDSQLRTEKQRVGAQQFFKQLVIIDDLAKIDAPILKATIVVQPQDTDRFMADVTTALGNTVHVTTSGYGAIDIVNANVNKATGLAYLADKLGIVPADMMAFGDGLNDLEMLTYVGHPYIMPNSDPLLLNRPFPLAVADHEHDGVSKTLLEVLPANN